MAARQTVVILVLGVGLGAWAVSSSDRATTPADSADVAAYVSPNSASAVDATSSPRFARARIVVKGDIDESRFAALQVEVVERRANGQITLLIPADQLDAFRSLPGNYTTRISTPANAL